MNRYTTGASSNYGRVSDPVLDDLFSRQARTLDHNERKRIDKARDAGMNE